MLLVSALLLAVQASTITFHEPAERAAVVVPKLAKAMGLNLEVNPQTANEILLIQVKDVPQQDLLGRIAKVADAEWKQEKDVLRLIRPSAIVQREERGELRKRVEMVEGKLAADNQSARRLSGWTQNDADAFIKGLDTASDSRQKDWAVHQYAGYRKQILQFPAPRAIVALMTEIGADTIARIGEDERVVYALKPTAMQRRLPSGAESVISQFVAHQKMLVDAYTEPGIKSFNGRYPSNWFDPQRKRLGSMP